MQLNLKRYQRIFVFIAISIFSIVYQENCSAQDIFCGTSYIIEKEKQETLAFGLMTQNEMIKDDEAMIKDRNIFTDYGRIKKNFLQNQTVFNNMLHFLEVTQTKMHKKNVNITLRLRYVVELYKEEVGNEFVEVEGPDTKKFFADLLKENMLHPGTEKRLTYYSYYDPFFERQIYGFRVLIYEDQKEKVMISYINRKTPYPELATGWYFERMKKNTILWR